MSPFSLLQHSIARSTPRSAELFDFREVRRIDWRPAPTASQPASEMPATQNNAQTPRIILRRGKVITAIHLKEKAIVSDNT